jgi:hypothetical protein
MCVRVPVYIVYVLCELCVCMSVSVSAFVHACVCLRKSYYAHPLPTTHTTVGVQPTAGAKPTAATGVTHI